MRVSGLKAIVTKIRNNSIEYLRAGRKSLARMKISPQSKSFQRCLRGCFGFCFATPASPFGCRCSLNGVVGPVRFLIIRSWAFVDGSCNSHFGGRLGSPRLAERGPLSDKPSVMGQRYTSLPSDDKDGALRIFVRLFWPIWLLRNDTNISCTCSVALIPVMLFNRIYSFVLLIFMLSARKSTLRLLSVMFSTIKLVCWFIKFSSLLDELPAYSTRAYSKTLARYFEPSVFESREANPR